MKKEKLSLITITLFAIAVLLLIYTVYTFYNCFDYLQAVKLEQELTLFSEINYYYNQCASPFIFALILYVLGEMNQKLKIEIKPIVNEEEQEKISE